MQIKKAAEAAGLTERAVRLYEERGLIAPAHVDKNGRDFREYTDADVETLRTIALLRRALFTIDEIREISLNPESIPAVVSSHKERMHIDFENLSYLVSRIDRVDENTVDSAAALADAIFSAPTAKKQGDTEPTEEEKILFSEQYERIYEKYFSENTGWERRYSASLKIRNFFDSLSPAASFLKSSLRIGCTVLIVGLFVFFLLYAIADVTEVDYTIDGYSFYVGAPDEKETCAIRIEGRYKRYLIRDDVFEGIVYIDGYIDDIEKEPYKHSFVVSEKGLYQTSFAASKNEIIVHNDGNLVHHDRAYTSDGVPCLIRVMGSFNEDFELEHIAVMVYSQLEGRPGSYTWDDDSRVMCLSFTDSAEAYELFARMTE